jgi:hypothetical protein
LSVSSSGVDDAKYWMHRASGSCQSWLIIISPMREYQVISDAFGVGVWCTA